MGTNYYAHWTPPGAPAVTIQLHICKSFRMFQGSVFDRWSMWRVFLWHNEDSLKIVDESGTELSVAEFAGHVEAVTPRLRRRQFEWVRDNLGPDALADDWLDDDGYSFHRGEFT